MPSWHTLRCGAKRTRKQFPMSTMACRSWAGYSLSWNMKPLLWFHDPLIWLWNECILTVPGSFEEQNYAFHELQRGRRCIQDDMGSVNIIGELNWRVLLHVHVFDDASYKPQICHAHWYCDSSNGNCWKWLAMHVANWLQSQICYWPSHERGVWAKNWIAKSINSVIMKVRSAKKYRWHASSLDDQHHLQNLEKRLDPTFILIFTFSMFFEVFSRYERHFLETLIDSYEAVSYFILDRSIDNDALFMTVRDSMAWFDTNCSCITLSPRSYGINQWHPEKAAQATTKTILHEMKNSLSFRFLYFIRWVFQSKVGLLLTCSSIVLRRRMYLCYII